MRHENSVMHDVLQRIPWDLFDGLVEKHDADRCVRTLTTKSQLVAPLHAELSGASSLREIEATMSSHEARLYHIGAVAPKRSKLADANSVDRIAKTMLSGAANVGAQFALNIAALNLAKLPRPLAA